VSVQIRLAPSRGVSYTLTGAKGTQGELEDNSWKPRDPTRNRLSKILKKGQLTLSQGMMKKGDDVVVDGDDDDAVRTSVSQSRVTATLCTEELFPGLGIYCSVYISAR
jgi:hypothetical protein